MRRRRPLEHTINHERWLVSYADFITLLFAFFVVMYSISQVNESQYRVLSDTLTEAFNLPEHSRDPIQIGRRARSSPINLVELQALVEQRQLDARRVAEEQWQIERFMEVSRRIEESLGDLIDQQVVMMQGTESWLEIELPSSLLFDSGEAELNPGAMRLLGDVADLLGGEPYSLRVEGFTDSVPINTPRFPSNWELSSARAAAVVRLFAEEGIDPERMSATGYGEFRPVADNTTAEGRARNRRVLIKLARHTPDEEAGLAPRTALPDAPALAPSPVPVPRAPGSELDPADSARQRAERMADDIEAARRRGRSEERSEVEEPQEQMAPGVRAIPLEGGGLLFTRDPDAAPED